MTPNVPSGEPDITAVRGGRHRLPDYFAVWPLGDVMRHLGLSLHEPAEVLLALAYRMAARAERSTAARLLDEDGIGSRFSHSPDGFHVQAFGQVIPAGFEMGDTQ